VLVIDDLHEAVSEMDEPFNILRVSDLPIEPVEVHRMALLFGGKLIATIKPWVFQHFLSEGADVALYIDSDFVIYASLEGMADGADDGVVLVPHVLSPLPRDGMDPDETSLLGSGLYNAGMFGVGGNHGGFLEFLMERLSRECVFDPQKMRFNEQRWLDFVPSLFPYRVVRDPGIDVAYWNLHERPLSKDGEQWLADGELLRAFHFSSFDPRGDRAAGRYEWASNPRVRFDTDPLLAQLCEEYSSLLYAEGFEESKDRPFAFEMLPGGAPVYESLRTLFLDAVLKADNGLGAYPPDPFDPSSRRAFDHWAAQNYARAGLSLPRRLAGAPSLPTNGSSLKSPSLRSRLRSRFGTRPGRDEATDPAPPLRPIWAVDILDRMILDDAGARHQSSIEILPERAGFVCHGPRVPLGAGSYVVTLEFDGQPVGEGMSPLDQALVLEGFVQGYAVGSVAATFADLSGGILVLDVDIPSRFVRESVLHGLELRLLTRGHVHARLVAVVLESVAERRQAVGSGSTHHDWLPVMAGGDAGRRAGVEVVSEPALTGVVVAGPNWRLVSGPYHCSVQMRLSDENGDAETTAGPPVADVEVVANDRVLDSKRLTRMDIERGRVDLAFVIDEIESAPGVGIGIRIRTLVPVALVVSSVAVDRHMELSEANESVA
jgi:hypothetical protein